MSQQETIRTRRKELETAIEVLKIKQAIQLEQLRSELHIIQTECAHPDMKSGYNMGEACSWCPDCGINI